MATLSELRQFELPMSTGACATYPWSEALATKFQFVSRFGDTVPLYRASEDGKLIHLPRGVCPVGNNDNRVDGMHVVYPKQPKPYEYQAQLFHDVEQSLRMGESGVFCAATGWGKCKDPDEPMLMFDGTIKKARDVQVGDQVMGPDSTPRNVTNVNYGYGPMVRIVPTKGDSWKCNDVHILSLRCTSDNSYGYKGQIINVPVKEWLSWPKSKQHVYKLWRTGVSFPARPEPEHDPYLVGSYLGDGSKHSPSVTLGYAKGSVRQAFEAGVNIMCTVFLPNMVELHFYKSSPFWRYIEGFVSFERHIPTEIKLGSRETRLQVLAGLLDTDGHLETETHTVFEILSVYERLATDIAFVARSLGLAAYVKEERKGCQTGAVGTYWRVKISGDTDAIPCRVPHKQALPRRQKKDVTNTGFRVESIGDGEYRGIALDGDHLYLLGDFTVTHNTVLGFHAAYVTQRKTLVITTKDDIFRQWVEGAEKFLGLKPSEIGIIRGDKCEVVGTKFIVAMVQSLSREGKYPDWIDEEIGLVVFDECHRVPADSFSEVLFKFRAKLRLGLSATPDRSDGKELIWMAHIGPLRASSDIKLQVPKVLLFNSGWQCPRRRTIDEDGNEQMLRIPHEFGQTTHIEKIMAADPERNHMLAEMIFNAHAKGRKTVVFSTLHAHLETLHRLCHTAFKMSGKDMGYYVSATTKAERAQREREKVKPVVFTTYSMASEGTNIPQLDTCILAMPRAKVTQPVGRILRDVKDKKPPVVMDMVDNDSPVFSAYSKSRDKWYRSFGCPIVQMN